MNRAEQAAALANRAARYADLRDGGMDKYTAAGEMGISIATCMRIERWYRSVRGLPRREVQPYPR